MTIPTSTDTRATLQSWFDASPYTDLKVWASPNSRASLESCEAQLLAAVLDMEAQERAGTLKLVPLEDLDV